MIASKEYVLKILEKKNLFPKKQYSQNFLINEEIAEKIVNLLECKNNEKVIEIGPGLGALSEIIISKNVFLTAYEIDSRMCKHLNETFSFFNNFSLISGDFLKQDIKQDDYKVISNLPYGLTTSIIEKILTIKKIDKFVFMVQKEVEQRLFAKLKTKEYSPLSIMFQHIGVLKKEFYVNKKEFFPIPNVDSLVCSLTFYNQDVEENIAFYKFLKKAFNMRRKTLINNLSKEYYKENILKALEEINLEENIRPEEINYENYWKIFHKLTTHEK